MYHRKMKNNNIVIIGAGLSGLSAAPLLAREGFKVTVVEKNSSIGGVAGSFSSEGFRFDTGPTWYLMPEIFENYFSLFGKSSDDYYKQILLDPSYRIFFSKNDFFDIKKDINYNTDLFERLEKGGGLKLKQYLEKSEFKYNIACNEFLYKDYKSILNFFNKRLIIDGAKLHLLTNLEKYIRKYFKNKKLRQILEFNTVFLGCAPEKTPALYSLMSYADLVKGVTYPEGGIYKFPEALYQLGKEYGVNYIFNNSVKKINVKNNTAESIITETDRIEADIILSTCDYSHLETELLEKKYITYDSKYWEKRTLAPTAFIIFLGIKKKLEALKHHNLFLAENWEKHFDSIFKHPSWPDCPSYYIGCSSKNDPETAPENCENLFILVPVAPGMDDNEDVKGKFSDKVISHFENLVGESICNDIAFRKIISHKDFKTNYNYYKGTSMGLAHTLFQTAVFRPSHKNRKVSNLYFAGHYTHPGIGMPMVVISSQVVSKMITEDFG